MKYLTEFFPSQLCFFVEDDHGDFGYHIHYLATSFPSTYKGNTFATSGVRQNRISSISPKRSTRR